VQLDVNAHSHLAFDASRTTLSSPTFGCLREDRLPEPPIAAPPPASADGSELQVKDTPGAMSTSSAAAVDDLPPSDPKQQSDQLAEVAKQQTNTSRCWRCNKKVGLLGFQCRCGFFFCGDHRYADSHDCAFDYKTFEREQLSKANQKVVAEKLHKI